MAFRAALRMALQALGRNKLRTVLTMLGITIGIGAVVMASGGLAMAAAVALGLSHVGWLVGTMTIYLAGMGLVLPQTQAGALTPFPDRAGTAASLMGLVQQALAAVIAAVIGAYLVQSAWPVTGVVVAMGCLTFLLWALTRGMRARAR